MGFRHISRRTAYISAQNINRNPGIYSVVDGKDNKQCICDIKSHSTLEGDGSYRNKKSRVQVIKRSGIRDGLKL